MLSLSEIHDIVEKGENSSVEFKESQVRSESIAKEIVAFSNSQGGLIILGVSDSGQIKGLDESKDYEEWIANIARNNVIPAVQIEFRYTIIDSKKVGIVAIPRGKDKPYQTNDAKYLIRVGSTNRIATQSELLRLFQTAGTFHYDATPVAKTSSKILNLSKIDTYFQRYEFDFSSKSEQDKISILVNSDILAETTEVTVGGLLIFGINPSRYLPQCGISFAHFRGKELSGTLIDKQNIDGTIDYQIDTGVAVIKNNLLTPSQIIGTKREDINSSYSDKVFRELLTNACVHRNYAIEGSRIRVFMFDDRIEFISPGRLPNTVTIEKLKVGVSYAVNPILVKFMENLRYIDRLGRGLPMVYREAQKSGRDVEFKEVGEEFKVVLSLT